MKFEFYCLLRALIAVGVTPESNLTAVVVTVFSSSNAANAGVADVRVDEESKEKYQSILDLLLAGGYFRARITGLSPFDKVIGGMAWAITSAAGDLDIDIFFQEDAQIGQKIKLGEQAREEEEEDEKSGEIYLSSRSIRINWKGVYSLPSVYFTFFNYLETYTM